MKNIIINDTKKRVAWIDIAKGFAIFAIVLGHTLYPCPVRFYLSSFHVPIFFFLSGVLFSSGNSNFKKFFNKKIKLMIAYYVFAIISIIIFIFMGKFASQSLAKDVSNFSFIDNFVGMLYGNGKNGLMKWNLPLWFLPCLFITSIIFFFVEKFFIKKKKLSTYIIIAISFAILGYINTYYLKIFHLPLGIETSINMLPFFICGLIFKNFFYSTNVLLYKNIYIMLLGIVFIISGFAFHFYNGPISCLADAYNNIILFYLAAFSGIFGWILIAMSFRSSIFKYIGEYSLIILLIHKFPILFFQTIVPFTKVAIQNSNLLIAILVSFISIFICVFFKKAFKKPFSKTFIRTIF